MAYYATYMPNELGELQKVVINAGVGFVLPYYGETAPPGTLACDGSEISREAYKELFQVLGTKAGAGNGSTTFNLPDFRGDFIRCVGGNAAELGVEQGDAIRNITGNTNLRPLDTPESALPRNIFSPGTFGCLSVSDTFAGFGTYVASASSPQNPAHNGQYMDFDASRIVPTAAENRPVNVALLWCIIYE